MQKSYSIVKIGYSRSVNGLNGEYFRIDIFTGSGDAEFFIIQGLYTNGTLIGQYLRELGYKRNDLGYQPFKQLTRNDLKGWNILSEYQVIDELKTLEL